MGVIMRRLLVPFSMLCFSHMALACRVTPMNLYREHADLIGGATAIVLAEAVVGHEATSNSCRFRLVRTLKGRTSSDISVSCRSPFAGESTTDLSSHNVTAFWQQRMGRVTYGTTCQLIPPVFTVGHKYLLIIGVEPDTKQFEEIVEPNDKWLLFVEQHL